MTKRISNLTLIRRSKRNRKKWCRIRNRLENGAIVIYTSVTEVVPSDDGGGGWMSAPTVYTKVIIFLAFERLPSVWPVHRGKEGMRSMKGGRME